MKKKVLLALMLAACLLVSFAWAECNHTNVNHSYVKYTYINEECHSSQTLCVCMDCGKTLACHPQPGPTPATAHSFSTKTTYAASDSNQHQIIIQYSCACGYSYSITGSQSHDYVAVNDYHGTGVKHYIVYRCSLCGQTKTVTYTCPGNPCYLPATYRQAIEQAVED